MFGSFWENKKVLITGHTGFKGSWLCMWLKKLGADISGYSLNPPTVPSLFEICGIKDHINSHTGDIRDKGLLAETMKRVQPQIIFHLAAQPLVGESYENPAYTYETNVMGTVNLFEAVRSCASVRAVINVTSDKCYANKESFWGYRENDRLGGYDPYSSSKACSELVTESFRSSFFHPGDYDKHGVAIATARAGNVVGGGDFAPDRLIPDCLRGLVKNEKIMIRSPRAVRPWQHVLEALCGYIMLAERLCLKGVEYGGAWNFGPQEDNEKSVEYMVNKLCCLWGGEARQERDTNIDPDETCCLKLDSYKARQMIGFRPKWHVDKALEMVVKWMKEYINNNTNMYDVCLFQIKEYELYGKPQ